MKEVVLITGANGILAKQLAEFLKYDYSIRFLTRKVKSENEFYWDIDKRYVDPNALFGVNHIIHLAGTSIADKRWTKNSKRDIIESRVDSAVLIQEELIKQESVISSFISASAIGYYGTKTTETILTEESPKGTDFLSDVCDKWELIAESFKLKKIAEQASILRIGIILSQNGGLLQKIKKPIKYYLGAVLGDGKQYIPWIHIYDLCIMIKYILDNKNVHGTFNAVSPDYVTNYEISNLIAQKLNRTIILPNIPKFIIRIFFGEMSVIILEGTRVSPDKIINSGFIFKFNKLRKALNNLVN